ncbi:MAG: glycosyltransferase family 2 protein [Gammaproteobacteria bacterium]|nr:glycosyltransferase family 2 protein [Gammaproteobacteria bacterium]
MTEIFVIFSIIFIFYAYFGYFLILFLFKKKNTLVKEEYYPKVSVIIAAYNEEDCIRETIESILKSDYPADSFEIWVSSDGSTDGTDEIVKTLANSQVHFHRVKRRAGKVNAILEVVNKADGEILILIDASSRFLETTIKTLIRYFADASIGSVTGRKKIIESKSDVSNADGLYWRYEAKLRELESRTGSSLIGCEGALTAVRKSLFSMDFPKTIAEDNALGYQIYEQGYRNIYEPEAIILEDASKNMKQEFLRKIRVSSRGIQAMVYFYYLFNPIKHPMFVFQNISHRICRWVAPFFLIFILLGSFYSDHILFRILFLLQILFYGAALFGLFLPKKQRSFFLISIPLYFTTVNLAAFFAWFFVFKNHAIFERTEREKS